MLEQTKRKWLIVGLGLVCAVPLWLWRGGPTGVGSTIEARLTLISSDKDDLACGAEAEYGGFRCAFLPNGEAAAPAPSPERTLAPYMNHQRRLFLIPDLFAAEPLRLRYEADSTQKIPRSRRKRFDAVCQLRLLAQADGVAVRWLKSRKVEGSQSAWVAIVQTCKIQDS